jgi:hypothetical protein
LIKFNHKVQFFLFLVLLCIMHYKECDLCLEGDCTYYILVIDSVNKSICWPSHLNLSDENKDKVIRSDNVTCRTTTTTTTASDVITWKSQQFLKSGFLFVGIFIGLLILILLSKFFNLINLHFLILNFEFLLNFSYLDFEDQAERTKL